MTECKLSKGVWDPADVCQSGVRVEALAAEGDACSSSPLGNCDLPDTCHGKGAGVNRVMDVSIVRRPTDMEWDGSHACPVDSFVIEGTGWGSDVDTVCNNPDTCKGMRVHPLYVCTCLLTVSARLINRNKRCRNHLEPDRRMLSRPSLQMHLNLLAMVIAGLNLTGILNDTDFLWSDYIYTSK